MAGVYIHQSTSENYYSVVIFDDNLYNSEIKEAPTRGNKILWKKGNVSVAQIQNSRETKDSLVERLNKGEQVDLKKELDGFFE